MGGSDGDQSRFDLEAGGVAYETASRLEADLVDLAITPFGVDLSVGPSIGASLGLPSAYGRLVSAYDDYRTEVDLRINGCVAAATMASAMMAGLNGRLSARPTVGYW